MKSMVNVIITGALLVVAEHDEMGTDSVVPPPVTVQSAGKLGKPNPDNPVSKMPVSEHVTNAVWRSVPGSTVTPERSAPVRFTPVRSVPTRLAFVRSAPERSAPVRFAPPRSAFTSWVAPERFAPVRFAPTRLAFERFAPERFALKFALLRLHPDQFTPGLAAGVTAKIGAAPTVGQATAEAVGTNPTNVELATKIPAAS